MQEMIDGSGQKVKEFDSEVWSECMELIMEMLCVQPVQQLEGVQTTTHAVDKSVTAQQTIQEQHPNEEEGVSLVEEVRNYIVQLLEYLIQNGCREREISASVLWDRMLAEIPGRCYFELDY